MEVSQPGTTAAERVRAMWQRARDRLFGSDPGLLRLQAAGRTTLTLAVALLVLYLLAKATGQAVTVALLGVVIALLSSMAVNEPNRRQQDLTMALLPLPAAAAVSLGALLAPHVVAGDVVFVVVIFAAVYVRRFGPRGMALGMVAFMTYFFALFLGAKVAQLPWLIGAVVIGTACSWGMRTYVLPDRPEPILRRTLASLWARVAAVVGATGGALQAGRLEQAQRRKLRSATTRLNDTALLVGSQLEDKVDAAALWPGVADDELEIRLFDAELSAERLSRAGAAAAAVAGDLPPGVRRELVDLLALLGTALSARRVAELDAVSARAQRMLDQGPDGDLPSEAARLALALLAMAEATRRVRTLADEPAPPRGAEPDDGTPSDTDKSEGEEGHQQTGLRPTTRQAIQVAVAASLAIVAGELLSPARWYWAVIATFVIFSGTTSRGETLTKGWQRLLGTALGVPAGVVVAVLVGGNTVWSIVLIFVCIFCAFYFIKVAYSLMVFWITTMLALLYGLLGSFSVGLLVLRIEETAIGAAIGVGVAILVLPTSTRGTVRDGIGSFLDGLGELVDSAGRSLLDDDPQPGPATGLTEQARALDTQLQQLRSSAAPLTGGMARLVGRDTTRRGLRVLTGCDHYARTLARSGERPHPVLADPAAADLAGLVRTAVRRTRDNIGALACRVRDDEPATVRPATALLDAADRTLDDQQDSLPEVERLRTALAALRSLDQSVVGLAVDLGAEQQVGHGSERVATPA